MCKLLTPSQLGTVLSLGVVLLLNGCPSVPVTDPGIPQTSPHELDTATYHTVKPGETLYSIARLYGRDYTEVAEWNGIESSSYALSPGQKLRVDGPSKRLAQPLTPDAGIPVETPLPPISTPISPLPEDPSSPSSTEGLHVVKAGETLYGIATHYGQTVIDVATWNNIEPPYPLKVGQTLVVSPSKGWDSLSTPVPTEPKVIEPEPSSPASAEQDYHTVLPGDTLYKIAKHYGFTVEQIAGWNGIEPPYNLSLGQRLRVSPPDIDTSPSSSPSAYDTFEDDGDSSDYHIVAQGETLYSISRTYGHSVDELIQWNNLSSSSLSLGQKLRITPPSTMMPGLTPDSSYLQPVKLEPSTAPDHHIVKKGESLSSIAKRYGLSITKLAEINGIGSPYTVYPGMRLTIVPR
jgi:peptidoglycan DL-endopeptidase LytF